MIDFSKLYELKENNKIEAKKAVGGLPVSVWETFSSFANTDGGIILLGANEKKDGTFQLLKLENPEQMVKQLWDCINNSRKVSANILINKDIYIYESEDVACIVINVPRADRHSKPVYINDDIFGGTYRRNWEGDYHCTREEVMSMLRDQSDKSQDNLILTTLSVDALDKDSIRSYRNRMASHRPGHVWEKLSDIEFLERLGALARDKGTKEIHPTAAGLLMFGIEYQIVKEYPNYFLDYQEHMDPSIRWTDRIISSSGEWSGNIYEFYFRVYNKISMDIKAPFKLENGSERIDDTDFHKALREALVNSLIHANYYDRQGLVVKKYQDKIIIENPGCLRVSLEQAIQGGKSDPRNATLIKMFNLVNIGERAGSGIPNIFDVWETGGLESPTLNENFNPDRTVLLLPLIKKKSVSKKTSVKGVGKKASVKIAGKKVSAKTLMNYEKILDYLEQKEDVKSVEIANILGIKATRVRELLRALEQEGKIMSEGTYRDKVYKKIE